MPGFASEIKCKVNTRALVIIYSFVVASRSNDGVCHADELFMLFKAHQVPVTMVRTQADKRVRQENEEFLHLQLTLLWDSGSR